MNPYLDREHQALYFMVSGPFAKIGLSINPWKRAGQVLSDSSTKPEALHRGDDDVYVLGYIERCDHVDERAVHMLMGTHHVCGEWFRTGPHVDDALNNYLPRGGDRGRSRWFSRADSHAIKNEIKASERALADRVPMPPLPAPMASAGAA